MSQLRKDPRHLGTCTRRDLWRALFQETVVTARTLKGGQALRLCDLPDWPDERLALLRPKLSPEYEVLVQGNEVCARHKGTGSVQRLFATDRAPLTVFNQFNGQNDLAGASRALAREMGWDEPQALAFARDLFLDLVARLVVLPANMPDGA